MCPVIAQIPPSRRDAALLASSPHSDSAREVLILSGAQVPKLDVTERANILRYDLVRLVLLLPVLALLVESIIIIIIYLFIYLACVFI